MTTPPDTLILDRAAVGRLNFQPRVCPAPMPCIAARVGDVLEVVFDPPDEAVSRPMPKIRHRYHLEVLSETVLTGTLITTPKGTTTNG